jgi:UDP-2,3-diacylglucosamine hydrolase
MVTYFISDLHLSPQRPETSTLFLKFLATEARNAQALYILGDLFESWVGDDNFNIHDQKIIEGLAEFAKSGILLYFMHGNRDFLIGQKFAERACYILLPDPTVIELYQNKILLTHGDQLCTFDKAYQRFRWFVQHPVTKKFFLKLPLRLRQAIARALRAQSSKRFQALQPQAATELHHATKQMTYKWDVALNTVYKFLREHQAYILIHGHTHKPGIHHFILDNHKALRIVLGEWGMQGNVLAYSPSGPEFKIIS